MANITKTYSSYADDMRLLPMQSVSFGWPYGADTYSVTFENLESDSTWSIAPVQQQTDRGTQRVVGWVLSITAVVSYDSFEDMRPWLERLAFLFDQEPDQDVVVELKLKASVEQAGGAEMGIGLNAVVGGAPDTPEVERKTWGVSWHIDSAEWRPRLTVDVRGMFSRDAITLGDRGNPDTHGYGMFTQIDRWPELP